MRVFAHAQFDSSVRIDARDRLRFRNNSHCLVFVYVYISVIMYMYVTNGMIGHEYRGKS